MFKSNISPWIKKDTFITVLQLDCGTQCFMAILK